MTEVYVCKEWFPNKEHPERSGFRMEEQLKIQIDILLKNITKDWDFTIIITGQGEVRVGKSMIAMQIACYWAYMIWKMYGIKVPYSVLENFVFDGKKLIEIGNKLGINHPYSPLLYDEAGADLEGRKTMQTSTQDVLDYYRECGQYNMLNILVLPEYFDLPKGLALSRSIFLIDVYYTADAEGIFKRGYFNFFSRRQKKWLYLLGKKDLNYSAANYDFHGRFYPFYPVNEKEYRDAKQDALSKRESKKRNKFQMQRDASWFLMWSEFGIKQEDIGKRMENLTGIFVPQNTISDALRHYKMENE
jgi:hypothetical protein